MTVSWSWNEKVNSIVFAIRQQNKSFHFLIFRYLDVTQNMAEIKAILKERKDLKSILSHYTRALGIASSTIWNVLKERNHYCTYNQTLSLQSECVDQVITISVNTKNIVSGGKKSQNNSR